MRPKSRGNRKYWGDDGSFYAVESVDETEGVY
jgi:hypothetical protein